MPPDAQAQPYWPEDEEEDFVFNGWVPAVALEDNGWGQPPEPPLQLECLDYFCCFLMVLTVCLIAVMFRRLLLDSVEYSVVNGLPLLVTKMHMLVMKSSPSPAPASWTAVALLPTCPARALALSSPPVCYEWEKPAAALVLPGTGSSGSGDSNWRSDEQDGDYKVAKKCKPMKCIESLLGDPARTCFVWSYDDAIPLTRQSDDPPPT